MKKIIYIVLALILISSVIAFPDADIVYVALNVRNSTDNTLYDGTFTITSEIFLALIGGSAQFTQVDSITINNGTFAVKLNDTDAVPFDSALFIEISVESDIQTPRLEYIPALQCQLALNSTLLAGFQFDEIPLAGDVTGDTGTSIVSAIDFDVITYSNTLGEGNISPGAENQILKTVSSTTVWAAESDTNETPRFENLTAFDCPGGETMVGVQNNGTPLCIINPIGNPFNQSLNTTDDVRFNKLNLTDIMFIDLNEPNLFADALAINNTSPIGSTNIRLLNDVGDGLAFGTLGSVISPIFLAKPIAAGIIGENDSGIAFSSKGGPMVFSTTQNKTIIFASTPDLNQSNLVFSVQINPVEQSLIFQGDKEIKPTPIDGGDALLFKSRDSLDAGGFPFIFVGNDSFGNETLILWLQNGANNSFSGLMNSFVLYPTSWVLETNPNQDLDNLSFVFNTSNYIQYCTFLQDNLSLVPEGCKYFADTPGRLVPLASVGDLEVIRSATIHEGLDLFESFNYVTREGNDASFFNGSILDLIPVTFTTGFEPGDPFTALSVTFPAGIAPFVNQQADLGDWIITTSTLCDDSPCAEASGAGVGNVSMVAPFSTLNVNETNLSFVYSLQNLIGGGLFSVLISNSTTSELIFSDSTSDVDKSFQTFDISNWDNQSDLNLTFECFNNPVNPTRLCFVDTVLVNGLFTANTTAEVDDFDSEFCGADGSRDANGNCNIGIRWSAEAAQWIISGTLNATGTISGGVSGTGTATNWARWTGSTSLGNAPVSDDGSLITYTLATNSTGNQEGESLIARTSLSLAGESITSWDDVNITDHSLLSNLDFASSGHTGFASQTQLDNVNTTGNIELLGFVTGAHTNNCNASGTCASGDVTYLDFANTGSLNITANYTGVAYRLGIDPENHLMEDNATCIIIRGDTSTLNVC